MVRNLDTLPAWQRALFAGHAYKPFWQWIDISDYQIRAGLVPISGGKSAFRAPSGAGRSGRAGRQVVQDGRRGVRNAVFELSQLPS